MVPNKGTVTSDVQHRLGVQFPRKRTCDAVRMLPARLGKIKTLETRFRLGGSLNYRDVDGNTPIHGLAISGHFKAVRYFTNNYLMFELDMNAKSNDGNTARNLAILNGHHDIAYGRSPIASALRVSGTRCRPGGYGCCRVETTDRQQSTRGNTSTTRVLRISHA